MELHDCPCSGKTLARLVQPAVMALLAAEPIHGYLIVQRLAEMRIFCGQKPDPSGVYRVLKALEQEGMVKATLQMAVKRPAQRRFALTAAGRACLVRWAQTLQEYEESMIELLAKITQATQRDAATKPARRAARCSHGTDCCANAAPR
ncbi:MAG: PadR family transcriptional regulator [Phycisphaerae bacterium]